MNRPSLRKLFNIYPGEEKSALYFALLGFLWALAVSLGWKNSDALFLLNVGAEELPTAYGIIAICMIGIASFMIFAFNTYPIHRIFLSILTLGMCFYFSIFLVLKYGLNDDSKTIWYALRIFGWIFFSLMNTTYWTFLDQFYHLRDSKRLFCLFSSAIFLGIASTGLVMHSGFFEFKEIALIIMALILLTMYWIVKIVKTIPPIHEELGVETAPLPLEQTFKETLLQVARSKFTLCLMGMNFLIFVSMILTEYNYMLAFEEALNPLQEYTSLEEDAPLTLFLGQYIALASIFNLIFGLFLYSRFLRRFGLTGMLFITPSLLIITYLGWPLSSTLLFPLLAFFISESTLYVIDDNNFNLLLNGVPTKLKYKIRVIIESFFEPVGTLTSAILLSQFASDSKTLALSIALILFSVCIAVRFFYPKSIYQNLMENAVHFEKSPKDWLLTLSKKERKLSELQLLNILKLPSTKAHNFAIEGLLDFEDPTILDEFLLLLTKSSPEAKKLFIEKVETSLFARDQRVIETLQKWAEDNSCESIFPFLNFYLAKQGLLSPQKALSLLKSDDYLSKGAAIIALEKSSAELRLIAAEELDNLLNSEDENGIIIGIKVITHDASREDINILLPYLHHKSLPIMKQAAKSIGEIANNESSHLVPYLIKAIQEGTDNTFRLDLLVAIGKMANTSNLKEILLSTLHFRPNERRLVEKIVTKMGLKTVPTLLTIVKDVDLSDNPRLLAGKILGTLSLEQLRANLYPIISNEIERAKFYFFHYHTLETGKEKKKLEVLKSALLTGYHSTLDFTIQLLGVSGEIEDSELLSRSLRSKNPKVRSQVIETLEKTCEPTLFRLLEPLVDELPIKEKLRACQQPALSLEELLLHLSNSPSLVDQIASHAVSSSLNLPSWQTRLKLKMKDNNPLFNHFAYEILG